MQGSYGSDLWLWRSILGYEDVYLGIIEAVTIFAEMIGSISILFLPLNPVTGYFIFALLDAFFGLFLFLPRHISSPELRNFIIISVLFIQSYSVSALAYTQIIFNKYYDENGERYEHSIWYSLTFLGYLISLVLAQFAVYNLGMSWEWAKMLWSLYMFLIGVIMYFYLDDHSAGSI